MWYIIILYGIYLKGSGAPTLGSFQIMVEKSASMTYNMLNKVADTIAYTYPFPAKIQVKITPLLCRSWGVIFYG